MGGDECHFAKFISNEKITNNQVGTTNIVNHKIELGFREKGTEIRNLIGVLYFEKHSSRCYLSNSTIYYAKSKMFDMNIFRKQATLSNFKRKFFNPFRIDFKRNLLASRFIPTYSKITLRIRHGRRRGSFRFAVANIVCSSSRRRRRRRRVVLKPIFVLSPVVDSPITLPLSDFVAAIVTVVKPVGGQDATVLILNEVYQNFPTGNGSGSNSKKYCMNIELPLVAGGPSTLTNSQLCFNPKGYNALNDTNFPIQSLAPGEKRG
uniref:Uncharacterized protein n=1 Tax=Romanomermis culicivorax TaxID=13658 RepID=A0A915HT84_ROMCU